MESVILKSQSLIRIVGFNGGISILAANNFFPTIVHALLDASLIESTENCKGCGKVKKEKPPELRLRKRRIRKVMQQAMDNLPRPRKNYFIDRGFMDGIFL